MYSKTATAKSTSGFSEKTARLKSAIEGADAVLIGAGAGLSTSAGMTYGGERFKRYFSDFEEKYGFHDMYSGGFYPFPSKEEYWAYWSRQILINRYEDAPKPVYSELLELMRDKNYFVLTTNVDHQFQRAGFDKKRLFYTQGDYGLFQCPDGCHNKTYDNESAIREMAARQKDMRIPTELIPKCPLCQKPMITNLRTDSGFVEDAGWRDAAARYESFLAANANRRILLLELGVGYNTPVIIKYPFWKMTLANRNALYACVNYGEAECPPQIAERSVCLSGDIGDVIKALLPAR
ncbi:MAG: Sir2 silent information regulator family NAD-dependent deacetylase [Eubacteriales bacterium]|nr:Sir2 silent information regulator family NAD-dependent deacetylase [Eubacteriales bacterium]MDD3883171.1 Sir2 silent information regulator family NAD-dependent deacetylase [Eubacteriales bacterium]MDD4512446.1 Sir2 silent information regulator family NAD-dependent deacetylase [Eubacteriales bacterium]